MDSLGRMREVGVVVVEDAMRWGARAQGRVRAGWRRRAGCAGCAGDKRAAGRRWIVVMKYETRSWEKTHDGSEMVMMHDA